MQQMGNHTVQYNSNFDNTSLHSSEVDIDPGNYYYAKKGNHLEVFPAHAPRKQEGSKNFCNKHKNITTIST